MKAPAPASTLAARLMIVAALAALAATAALAQPAETHERARDLGIAFVGTPGKLNAITDVPGVGVSQVTVIDDSGGAAHAARTGVTAVFPVAKAPNSHVPGAYYALNGNGEMTGTIWLEESGDLEGPVLLTNTYSVGLVRDAVREWANKKYPTGEDQFDDNISLPIVAETYDGYLNDINGFHVKKEHVFHVLDNPETGPVAEGNVGGGTGMICFDFKCGIGTASRIVKIEGRSYTVGVLVQSNFGMRDDLLIHGHRVGHVIGDLQRGQDTGLVVPGKNTAALAARGELDKKKRRDGSIIVVVATDAPLLPHQLKRCAKRVPLGLGRTGAIGDNGSGDIFIAFSTVAGANESHGLQSWRTLSNERLDKLFRAIAEATEESVVNSLIAGRTMTGFDGHKIYAIPHDKLLEQLHPVKTATSGSH